MQEMTRSQSARRAIREFKTITEAVAIRGFYRPSGRLGKALETSLRDLSPEIYGTMNDPRIVEIKGLEYVIDRLPQGIEEATRIILTDEDEFENTPFEEIEPLRRRRTSYRIADGEICFVISRGISEIYDIVAHMTFLNIEAKKIYRRVQDDYGEPRVEWLELEKTVRKEGPLSARELDSAIWNLSIILGRPYQETRQVYESMEFNRTRYKTNNGIFSLIYNLARRIEHEYQARETALVVYLTPSLMNIIGHQKYGRRWAEAVTNRLADLKLLDRPLHIVSANMHSVVNCLYGFAALKGADPDHLKTDFYTFVSQVREFSHQILEFAAQSGMSPLPDTSGANIDCQIIDTAFLKNLEFHPDLRFGNAVTSDDPPVILVMDYAFGAQAFEVMESLLKPVIRGKKSVPLNLGSISIMGKAGILAGKKGDIMLATAHVIEGTSDNYIVGNDLTETDFDGGLPVFTGPMATVLGTSLQNRDVLEMFQRDWRTVGLEMEGGHYQKAINAAIIKGNLHPDIRTRYAYYASDNPLETGNTLAAGPMGVEGIKPTYMITKAILEKILCC